MYRILTENKNADTIRDFLAHLSVDYTIYYCEGSWRGQSEESMLIELDRTSGDIAEAVAQFIKEANIQHAVLLQEIPMRSRLV